MHDQCSVYILLDLTLETQLGGPRAGSLVLLFFSIFNTLMLIQFHDFKCHLYTNDPKFVSLAQVYSLNSSLIYSTVNSPFICWCLLAPQLLQSTARTCSSVYPLGSHIGPHSQEGCRLGLMLYSHHLEILFFFLSLTQEHDFIDF